MISRRELLKAAAALSAMAGLPKIAFANMAFAPRPSTWRTFEITTRVELLRADSAARAWIPLPVLRAGDWNRPGDITWTTNAASARIVRDDAGRQGSIALIRMRSDTRSGPAKLLPDRQRRQRPIATFMGGHHG
ncbi:twin-arginine translocation signal domain-containing protein [Rhizobium favelukesii]|uniref:Secreted protein n=2 Tax=Rhizobium/Agrobacterium group TaxID=227290 RepID=W6RPE6_9HYPH|nr:putative secreted protein [Rhizobium favelukesii]